jgi:hypothetical protein
MMRRPEDKRNVGKKDLMEKKGRLVIGEKMNG